MPFANATNAKPDELADFGYYATGKAGEYLQYETSSDLRDSESIPLKQNIHDYFKAEVQPPGKTSAKHG